MKSLTYRFVDFRQPLYVTCEIITLMNTVEKKHQTIFTTRSQSYYIFHFPYMNCYVNITTLFSPLFPIFVIKIVLNIWQVDVVKFLEWKYFWSLKYKQYAQEYLCSLLHTNAYISYLFQLWYLTWLSFDQTQLIRILYKNVLW